MKKSNVLIVIVLAVLFATAITGCIPYDECSDATQTPAATGLVGSETLGTALTSNVAHPGQGIVGGTTYSESDGTRTGERANFTGVEEDTWKKWKEDMVDLGWEQSGDMDTTMEWDYKGALETRIGEHFDISDDDMNNLGMGENNEIRYLKNGHEYVQVIYNSGTGNMVVTVVKYNDAE